MNLAQDSNAYFPSYSTVLAQTFTRVHLIPRQANLSQLSSSSLLFIAVYCFILILKTSGGIFWEFSPNLVPLRFPLRTTPFHILSLSYKNKQTKKHPSLKLTSCRKPRTSHCLTDIQATFSENSATRTWISFFPNSKNHLKAVMKTHLLCFSYLRAHALVGQLFLIVMNRYRNLIYDAT